MRVGIFKLQVPNSVKINTWHGKPDAAPMCTGTIGGRFLSSSDVRAFVRLVEPARAASEDAARHCTLTAKDRRDSGTWISSTGLLPTRHWDFCQSDSKTWYLAEHFNLPFSYYEWDWTFFSVNYYWVTDHLLSTCRSTSYIKEIRLFFCDLSGK